MTSFVLKIIAMVTMFCDHFGDAFIGHFSFLNLIGRIAFPIFAFQISEGFKHTKNVKKYFGRLLIFAVISQIPFYLFSKKFGLATDGLNIFFTLLLGLSCISIYNYFSKFENKELSFRLFGIELKNYFGLALVLAIACIGEVLNVDYGFWGVIVIFSFYLFKDNKLGVIMSFIALCILRYGSWIILYGFNVLYILLCIFTILPLLFIGLYNGKQGKKIKYLLYLFYPLHLLMLYFLF